MPDFPALKEELQRVLETGLRIERAAMLPLLGSVPFRPRGEGDRVVLVREDGEPEGVDTKTYTFEGKLNPEEVEGLPLSRAYSMYREAALKMGSEAEADLLGTINEAVEKIGNVVGGDGSAGAEVLLDAFEKVSLGFAPKSIGHLLSELTFVVGSEQTTENLQKAINRLGEEPYRSRAERLLEEKREEHRARESRRKLVG